MTSNEILGMLGLEDGVAEGEAESVAAESVAVAEEVPASEYAMKLDMWGKGKGKELVEGSEMLAKLDKRTAEAAADFYGAAFEPEPELEDRCVARHRHEFLKSMMGTAEYRELHASTAMEDLPSEIACASFAKQYYELVEGMGEPSELERMRAVGRAVREASKDVRDFKDACDACGLGGDGANPSAYDTKKAIEVYKRVRGSQFLRNLFNKAGKYKRFAAQMQRVKDNHGVDDAVGVIMGGSIADLLPSELASLAIPELELDILRKLMENEAMIRQYQGVQRVGKGPIFIVVDESGSMHGDKIADAKAVALSLAYLARQQNRWACLIGFSGGTQGNVLTLKPGRWGEADIVPWLEHFYSGGTDMDVPLVEIQKIYKEVGAPVGKTDMVCVTDAIVRVPPKMEESFLKWKKEVNLSMFTLIIGQGQPGDMTKVSDQVHMIHSLSTDEQGVQEVFKI